MQLAWEKLYYIVGVVGGVLTIIALLWRPVIKPLLGAFHAAASVSKEFKPNGGHSLRDAIDGIARDVADAKRDAADAKRDAGETKMKAIEMAAINTAQSKMLDAILRLLQQRHGGV